jgi:uncharacterized membrane protein
VVTGGVFRGVGDMGPTPWLVKAENAEALLAAIATATLTFVAILFSVTIVALQLASQQMSPRVMRVFARSTLTKLTLGLFMGTFAFSLGRLATLELSTSADDASPVLSVLVAVALTLVSLGLFLAFANRIVQLMSVDRLIDEVAAATRAVIETEFPLEAEYLRVKPPELGTGARTVTLEQVPFSLRGRPATHGAFLGADRPALALLAQQSGAVIELLPTVGSYVSIGRPVITVHGGEGPPDQALLTELNIDPERNLRQDPMFGIRQLVDIAAQALSPAVNAPTTAVTAIDRLEVLVHLIGSRPQPSGYFAAGDGTVLLIERPIEWEAVVDLAFVELRRFGAGQPQVTRRLSSSLHTLRAALPAFRHPPLDRELALLTADVFNDYEDDAEARSALSSEVRSLGIGPSHRDDGGRI